MGSDAPAVDQPDCAPVLDHVERDFDLRRAFPDYVAFFEDWRTRSVAARAAMDPLVDVPYGPGPRERLDFFRARTPGRPLVVFIHGGYWRSMDKSDFSFVAAPFVERDLNVALPNYPLSPEASISEMVARIRACCLWLCGNAARFQTEGTVLDLIGWSAGAHLAAMAATTRWPPDKNGGQACRIRSFLGISGIYDLYPVRHTTANAGFRINHREAQCQSPLYRPPPLSVKTAIAWGSDETPTFRAQSRALAHGWLVSDSLEVEACHHYAVMAQLANTDGQLFGMAIRLLAR